MLKHTEIEEIKMIHDLWISLEKQGRVEEILNLCHETVMCFPSGEPPLRGRDELASFWTTPGLEIHSIETRQLDIHGSDDLAFKTARFTTKGTSASGDFEVSGSHAWVLEKQPNGKWMITFLSWAFDDEPVPNF